jgi:hypothetical protein
MDELFIEWSLLGNRGESQHMFHAIITIMNIICRYFFYLKHNNSETGFCPETETTCTCWAEIIKKKKKKKNSMVWVRERTIPTERPPLVGEVIANLCG